MALILRSDTILSAPGTAPKLGDIDTGLLSLFQFTDLGLADGASVASVAPKGGSRGLPLAETTTANQPKIALNVLNGQPVLDFTRASSNRIRTNTYAADQVPPLTIACVGRRKVTTVAGNFISGGVSGTAKSVSIEAELTANLARGNTVDGGNLSFGTADTLWHLFVFVVDGVNSRLHIDNNVLPGTITASANNVLPRLSIGCNASGSANYLDGQIAEVREYNRALTAADVAKLRAVCRIRYGSANLA